jgi:hypothetical protein
LILLDSAVSLIYKGIPLLNLPEVGEVLPGNELSAGVTLCAFDAAFPLLAAAKGCPSEFGTG